MMIFMLKIIDAGPVFFAVFENITEVWFLNHSIYLFCCTEW